MCNILVANIINKTRIYLINLIVLYIMITHSHTQKKGQTISEISTPPTLNWMQPKLQIVQSGMPRMISFGLVQDMVVKMIMR